MLLLFVASAFADSPLTSVELSAAYSGLPAVRAASARGAEDPEVLAFLRGDHGLGEKLAVVNAMGWSRDGDPERILESFARQKNRPAAELRLADLAPSERVVLGYALALDHYFDLEPIGSGPGVRGRGAREIVASGAEALPDVFSAQAALALVDAQAAMEGDWCRVWETWDAVLDRFPPDRRDLRPAAVEAATSYLSLYADSCAKLPVPAGAIPDDPHLAEIYDVVRYGDAIVTGTQGGLVVYDAASGAVRAAHPTFICSSLAVEGDRLWAGCYHDLVRYDGRSFTSAVHQGETGEGGAFDLFRASDGLRAVHEGRVLRLDGDRWVPTGDRTSAHDQLWTADGRWSIDFMTSLSRDARTFALRSEEYPGGDPRSFHTDPRGRVWVADFESGWFAFDPERDRFLRVPGTPTTKGSDVAFDAERGRTWALHYTDGLTLLRQGHEPRTLPLPLQEYLRAVWADPDGTVWVGGWHGLVRVRFADERFETTTFVP